MSWMWTAGRASPGAMAKVCSSITRKPMFSIIGTRTESGIGPPAWTRRSDSPPGRIWNSPASGAAAESWAKVSMSAIAASGATTSR
jgi:hypothetical protein